MENNCYYMCLNTLIELLVLSGTHPIWIFSLFHTCKTLMRGWSSHYYSISVYRRRKRVRAKIGVDEISERIYNKAYEQDYDEIEYDNFRLDCVLQRIHLGSSGEARIADVGNIFPIDIEGISLLLHFPFFKNSLKNYNLSRFTLDGLPPQHACPLHQLQNYLGEVKNNNVTPFAFLTSSSLPKTKILHIPTPIYNHVISISPPPAHQLSSPDLLEHLRHNDKCQCNKRRKSNIEAMARLQPTYVTYKLEELRRQTLKGQPTMNFREWNKIKGDIINKLD